MTRFRMTNFDKYSLLGCLGIVSLLFDSGTVVWAQSGNTSNNNRKPVFSLSTRAQSTAGRSGPTSPTGTGRPPRIGPNTQVNAPQQPFPNGLLGRSETAIATSEDGTNILVGFNDAQGFCFPLFPVNPAHRRTRPVLVGTLSAQTAA
jgi:hypothetical protein